MKSKKPKKEIIIVLSLILLAVLILILISMSSNSDISESRPSSTVSYLNENGDALEGAAATKSREEIMDALKKQQLVVTDKLSSNITFPSGKAGTIGDWVVENPSVNNIIQQAQVYLADNLIAESAPIYPNQHIESIELKQDVPSGEYDVTAYINYYNIDNKEFISKAGYKIHLTVR